jgi:lambda family phage minor tail protein L
MAVPVADLQQPSPSAIIELFEIQLFTAIHGESTVYRFHNGTNAVNNGQITWAGNGYQRMPIEADGFEYAGTGSLPRPTIRVSNLFGTITAILLALPNGLEGAKLTRIRTLARYLDAVNFSGGVNPLGTPDPSAEFPREVFYISQKTQENRDVVEFQCAAAFDLAGVRLPRRQAIANICQWQYRGTECGYTGVSYFDANDNATGLLSADVCGKRLSSCQKRFGTINTTGSVTSGSNQLILSNGAGVNPGDPISGFGVPSGTTVSSRNGNNVTMSQNATASSSVTGRNGTLSADGLTLIVTSTAGLAPGMTVTGNLIPSGTRISSISGNALRLNIDVNRPLESSIDTATVRFTTSSSGSIRGVPLPKLELNPRSLTIVAGSISGINVNDFVRGDYIYEGTRVQSIPNSTTIILDRDGNAAIGRTQEGIETAISFLATFYVRSTPTQQSYSFSAPNGYSFRRNAVIPFGSFPGVGGAY